MGWRVGGCGLWPGRGPGQQAGSPSDLLLYTWLLGDQDIGEVRCHEAPHLLAGLSLQIDDHVPDHVEGRLPHQQEVGG